MTQDASANLQQLVGDSDAPPAGYPELLIQLKERIRTTQIKAGLALNRELVLLYGASGGTF